MTNWRTKTIGDLVSYEQPSKYLVKDTNYVEDGTPVLTANKAFVLGYTRETEGIYVASKDSPVIIFDDFTTDNKFVDFDFKVKSSAIKILTAKSGKVLPRFVHGAMQLIKTDITEHKRRFISEYQFHPIDVPELPEQQRIVGVVEVWDEYIEKLEQKIALKEQLKKGLMQQLLTGKHRLPGFNEEWRNVKLSELGSVIRGVSYNPKADLLEDDTDSSVRLLRSNNVQKGKIILNDVQIVSSSKVRNNQLLQRDDIVVCMANGSKRLVGKSALFNKDDGFLYTIGAFMGVYRGGETIVSRLVRYLFTTSRYEYYIANTLSGSSINNLKGSDIESMEFRVPLESKEVLAISDALDVAQSEVDMLRLKQSTIIEQKKYLLKNLITGTIRTPENLKPKGVNS